MADAEEKKVMVDAIDEDKIEVFNGAELTAHVLNTK